MSAFGVKRTCLVQAATSTNDPKQQFSDSAFWENESSTALTPRRDDHDLAKGLAFGQQPDRFDAALKGESMSDAWLQLVVSLPSNQHLHRLLEFSERVVPEVTQRAAERRAVLNEQPVRWNLLDPPNEADKEHPPTPSEAGERAIGQLSADRVETDVGTLAIG